MDRPNILFVFDDQHRYSALGSSGNDVIRTPWFDRLAEAGVSFTQAFSSCPICSPFRGQVLTGRYAHANGVMDNEYRLRADLTTLPQALKRCGYRTGFVGKWHLGYPPYSPGSRYGFDTMAANNCNHSYYEGSYYENDRGPISIAGWAPEEETSIALRFLEEHREKHRESPFFLMLGWGPPHWPYDRYPGAFDTYDPEQIDLPPNVPVQMEAFARREIAHYYGNIAGLDAQMGRLLEGLDRLGAAENTIVVFTSDHGDHLSGHGYGKPMDRWMHPSMRASKATPYEESIHIPFIVRWPNRVRARSRSDTLLSSVDMMPTLLSLAGVEPPPDVQGTDLSHAVLGEGGPSPDSVYLQILGPGWPHRGDWVGFWRGVRTGRWTYARWHDDAYGPVLYDRLEDPCEMSNLAGDGRHVSVQESLESTLSGWIARTDDPFDTGDRDPSTGMLLLGQEFTHARWNR